MEKLSVMDRDIITYQIFDNFPDVKAFTSCRLTVTGEATPRFTGSPEWKSKRNKEKLAEVLSIGSHQLVFPRQTHTHSAMNLTEIPQEELNDTDALLTNRPEICLCVQTADCVPILLYDPVNKAVASIHAGWRGTVGLIVKEVIQKLNVHYLSSPKNIRAVIGPSIGPEKYEVGEEVVIAVLSKIPNADRTLQRLPSGKHNFNLWEANRQILLECGVLPENIQVSAQCTFTEGNKFFSARREGIQTGRMVSGIMLINPM